MTIKILIEIILVLVVVGLVFLLEAIREYFVFHVKEYEIKCDKWDFESGGELKIIFLSDLHARQYGKNNEKLLKKIRLLNPDLILIGGDMIIAKAGRKDYQVALQLVRELRKHFTVINALGNHEYRMREYLEHYESAYETFSKELRKIDASFLDNEYKEIKLCGKTIRIYGFTMGKKYYKRFRKEEMPKGYIDETLGKPEHTCINILLAHNPLYAKEYLEWGADLTLSGHYHGGMVRIPFFRGIISPQVAFFPKYDAGKFQDKNNHTLIVSKGLGMHTIPLRLFNVAEISLIKIK